MFLEMIILMFVVNVVGDVFSMSLPGFVQKWSLRIVKQVSLKTNRIYMNSNATNECSKTMKQRIQSSTQDTNWRQK